MQILGPSCIPLYRVLCDQNFETAFRSLIQGTLIPFVFTHPLNLSSVVVHHMLYKSAGILHCNLNTSSLMVSKDSLTCGILLDLDFALQVQDGDEALLPEPTLSGTLPFLSMDLLTTTGPPPPRLYRHDLESFFYILGWMLCRYDASGECKLQHQFAVWHRGPLDDIISAKWRFMRVPSHIPSERSSPSLQKWLRNLCRIFNTGYQEKDRDLQNPLFNHETLGGYVTFDRFMGAARQMTS
ncbi:uncharacterized protein EI90DRAFT_1979274 [Cantharellus anzutake]|uniref:uncharacterized protein n=1 Tax=Cantharellus anzutake TaxID=1750568 RepID=UPI001908C709|nr:uncharacterized protein EI90DRAFT_1979274 [Cantharellus anzutake]KAF8326004.1 hypothetical protein EI90DRAFT_1979274 [Cantharellus anzutake]